MEHSFIRCSSVCDDVNREYILSGLVPDYCNDLYVRPGYGALCFYCGSFNVLSDVIKTSKFFDNFYDFSGKISSGYRFVIGPGVSGFGGKIVCNAVYCINYEDVLSKLNGFYK